ncbi:hypothetical protein QFZ32_000039 [Streptomyces canus]|nr:hypothetical protein [Streptomyces canus]
MEGAPFAELPDSAFAKAEKTLPREASASWCEGARQGEPVDDGELADGRADVLALRVVGVPTALAPRGAEGGVRDVPGHLLRYSM